MLYRYRAELAYRRRTTRMGRNLQLILTEVYEPQCALGVGFFSRASIFAVVSAVESAILCIKEVDNKRML